MEAEAPEKGAMMQSASERWSGRDGLQVEDGGRKKGEEGNEGRKKGREGRRGEPTGRESEAVNEVR